MVPQRRGGFGRQGAGCHRIVDIAFAVHERKTRSVRLLPGNAITGLFRRDRLRRHMAPEERALKLALCSASQETAGRPGPEAGSSNCPKGIAGVSCLQIEPGSKFGGQVRGPSSGAKFGGQVRGDRMQASG